MGYQYRGKIHDVDKPLLEVAPEPPPSRNFPRTTGCGDAKGTTAGYKRHQKAGEDACAPCKRAVAQYAKEYRVKVRSGERFVRKGFSPERCGTYAGYTHHGRHGVPACKPCLKAYSAYMTQWRNNRKAEAA
jgi:hypothetical protein